MKHYLFLILLIICGTSIYAQHLNEEEFQKAHDRIVIAFTKAILPDYVKTLPKEEQTKYAQFIRKKLMKGEISNVNELDTLLRNNKFPDFADLDISSSSAPPMCWVWRSLWSIRTTCVPTASSASARAPTGTSPLPT